MPPTRNGVFHELVDSPFSYETCGMEFRFSSQRHLDRFREQLVARQVAMSATMSKRIGCEVDMSSVAALQLYRQVETFGFMVVVGDERVTAATIDSIRFSAPQAEVR